MPDLAEWNVYAAEVSKVATLRVERGSGRESPHVSRKGTRLRMRRTKETVRL
jgi:hypothetical protein